MEREKRQHYTRTITKTKMDIASLAKNSSNEHELAPQRIGFIILGNSGVGKSFLANLFLEEKKLVHKSAPSAVTRVTEFEDYTCEGTNYVIFDIPGLVEAQQARVDANKIEIAKAFQICPNAVILYVFGAQNGRIRSEDVIAFNALNDAYPFESKSLAIVINNVPQDRDENYEGETIALLRNLVKLDADFQDFCFLETIDKTSTEAELKLKNALMQAVLSCVPSEHEKKHDIRLQTEEITQMVEKIRAMQESFDQQRTQLMKTFAEEQERHRRQQDEQRDIYERNIQTYAERQQDLEGRLEYMESGEGWLRQIEASTLKNPLGALVRSVMAPLIVPGYLMGSAVRRLHNMMNSSN